MAPTDTKLEQAIAAASAQRARANVKITLGNGREIIIDAPVDLQPIEALALVGFIGSGGLANELARARGARRRLLVPS